ncbi:hypothetical protein JHK85_001705 [Glycine max]|uniref:Uncharacterized protein n=1 Tax=Glycine soja TaxID=3848 RepID=A0A445M2W5_GLYSO|nr:hypothetical protein JHK85_001705 [Glycine max]RZC29821.1 hypothetical protein D0Y65_001429 [Glycine soja]
MTISPPFPTISNPSTKVLEKTRVYHYKRLILEAGYSKEQHSLFCTVTLGFKLTKQSMWRSTPNWLAVSTSRYATGHFLANQGGIGLQFAQLGRDASAIVNIRSVDEAVVIGAALSLSSSAFVL